VWRRRGRERISSDRNLAPSRHARDKLAVHWDRAEGVP
jgi:hypothetical protein